MPAKLTPTWQNRVRVAIKNDPKRASVLTVLVAVLLVVGARTTLGSKASPAALLAGTNSQKTAKTDNAKDLRSPMRKDTHVAMRKWMSAPMQKVDRNLFAAKIDNYPQLSGKKSKNGSQLSKELSADEKSALQSADELKERQSLTEAMQLEARKFRLTSTVSGASPKALINGEMVKEGDVVASGSDESLDGDSSIRFRVLKIEARRVIIEREGIKLEILMK